jgi:hypothetical protein
MAIQRLFQPQKVAIEHKVAESSHSRLDIPLDLKAADF